MDLNTLQNDYRAKDARLTALLAKESLSAEESTEVASLDAECERLAGEIKGAQSLSSVRERAAQRGQWANSLAAAPVATATPAILTNSGVPGVSLAPAQEPVMPAQVARVRVTAFKDGEGLRAAEKAYQFGQWFLATSGGNQNAREYCRKQGIPLMGLRGDQVVQLAHTEGVNAQGGFLVPPQFENDLIDLREQYGVARRIFRNRKMSSDVMQIPRRSGGLTTYFVGEAAAITESSKSWDMVTLTARKLGVLSKYSTELGEDAVLDIGNDLAQEISYAFATTEDDCAFNGDGTSTYGGITGVRQALKGLSGTIANIAGLVVATGTGYATSYGSITLADFNAVKAKLPQYADNGNTCWVVHKSFFHGVMEKLALAAGGVTEAGIVAGVTGYRFLGYPVEITQKMPSTPAVSQVVALLGDFSLGCAFGDRRMTTIAMSEHSDFANDLIAVRGTERFDVVVHDVGNASGTASARVAGPIVGLITAAS